MALARNRRGDRGFDYWPGFVDALSTLILAIIFLLSVFVVVQFFLSQEVSGKDKQLERLNAQIQQLNELLSLEKLGKLNLDDQLSQMRAGLAAAESERDRVKGFYEGLASQGNDAAGRAGEAVEGARFRKTDFLTRAGADRGAEPAAQRAAPAARGAGSGARCVEKRDKDSQTRIAELGQRLNVALAQRVQELARYRPSEFFGRLRAILGNRSDIRIRRRPLRVPVGGVLRCRPGGVAARGPLRARSACFRAGRARAADPVGNPLGAARGRAHRRAADSQRTISLELGVVGGARHQRRAVPGLQGHLAATARRGRLWRIPARSIRTRPKTPTAATAGSN